ncbi:nucleotide pyrophosphohydrolase [Patescibacteria group bacterium]|nr:nucleotide pyrophosphohydrolase [Patescibacteria group bacterium]
MNEDQKKLDAHFTKLGWPYWKPYEILARLVEEVGELARIINHTFGPKPKKATEEAQELELEVGDIYFALICFANSNNINLSDALDKCIHKGETRDKDRF